MLLLSSVLLCLPVGSPRRPLPTMKDARAENHDARHNYYIDHDSGKIELKTDMGTSQVYFAPQSIKNLKEGDTVALELETSKREAKESRESRK